VRHIFHERIWFTCNAKLVDPLPNDGATLKTLAENLVLGLTFEPYAVWDYIPWSWLIDYFANFGDYIEATNALTRLQVTRMNVMATRVYRTELVQTYVESGLSASHSELKTTEKLRKKYGIPVPIYRFTPFLTGYQVGIIGALAVTRFRGTTPRGIA